MIILLLVSFLVVLVALLTYRKLRKPSLEKFKGKKVVLTGASAGIGEALAKQLIQLGAEVCLVARREELLLKLQVIFDNDTPHCLILIFFQSKAELKQLNANSKTHVIVGDVGDKESCKKIIQKSLEFMGGIDVLLLNAGIGCLIRLEEVPESDLHVLENVTKINYFANVYLTYYALAELKKSKGMIIVNSSLAGIGWSPDRCFYSASKHALRGFFNSLRCEVGKDVQITVAYPDFVKSEIHDICYHDKSQALSRTGYFMSSEECANLILIGAAKGERDYCMTWTGTIALKVNPFLGPLADSIAIKKASSGIVKRKVE